MSGPLPGERNGNLVGRKSVIVLRNVVKTAIRGGCPRSEDREFCLKKLEKSRGFDKFRKDMIFVSPFSRNPRNLLFTVLMVLSSTVLSAKAHTEASENDLADKSASSELRELRFPPAEFEYLEEKDIFASESNSPLAQASDHDEEEGNPVSVPEMSAYAVIFGGTIFLLVLGRRYLS